MQDKRTRPPAQSPDHDALGRAVRVVRTSLAVSQEELGYRSTLHRNYVGAIERGEINPTLRVLLKLSGGLNVRLSTLIRLYELKLAEMRR
jgi:transcriptional regulator with XRE-family HTH domain